MPIASFVSSSASALRPISATANPALASATAALRPVPEPAPVTAANFFDAGIPLPSTVQLNMGRELHAPDALSNLDSLIDILTGLKRLSQKALGSIQYCLERNGRKPR